MKKLLSVLLAIMLLLSATPVFAESETATTGSGTVEDPWVVYSWSALKEKMVLGGYIKLGEDVVDSGTGAITVPGGTEVTLDLNGFTVNRNLNQAQYYGYVILVNGELDITDSGETGKITGGNCRYRNGYTYGGGICINGGTCNLYGGSVCKNNSEGSGGICVMNMGTLNVYGGSISNNTTSSSGSGIGSYDSTVNIHGGVVTKNSCEGYGGGIYLDNSVLTMDNGLINGNHAYWGGGVCLSYGSSFVFNDGTISENNSGNTGGAVTCMEGSTATFTMNGGIISGNYSKNGKNGGGVYVGNNFKFYLNGGRITGNYVEYSNNNYTLELGGGVAVWGTGFYVKGSPVIKDNYCLNTATEVSTANDVDVQTAYGNWTVNLAGALEEGAAIGISSHGTGKVTSGFNTYHENDEPSKFFFANQQGYKLYKNADGEAEIGEIPKYTVSFNANGGTGTMSSVEVYEGEEYTLPSNTFKKEGRSSYGWKVGSEYKQVGDKITVTEDTVVTAVWAQTKIINLVKDRSTTDVEGTLTLKDTRTGEVFTKNCGEVTASSFTEPSNPTVNAMISEAKGTLQDKAKTIAGEYPVTIVKEEVSAPSIDKTVDIQTTRNVMPFDPSLTEEYPSIDENGDLFVYIFREGELSHHWRYDVAIEAEFTSEETKPVVPAPTPDPAAAPTPSLTPEEAAMPTEKKTEELVKKTNTDKKDVSGSEYRRLKLKATSKSKSITLKWKAVKKADGYIIYGGPCGKNMKRLATVKNGKTVKKTFKKLKKGKYYKYIVVAYKKTASGNRVISKSKSVHCATPGGKKGNPTGLKLKKTKIILKKGKKAKIKATLQTKGKTATHIAKFRYESSNKQIASVDKKGTVKAKKKGTATIYVYAQNGLSKKVKVKVK